MKSRRGPSRGQVIFLAFLIILLAFGVLVARRYFMATPREPVPPAARQEPSRQREVILYFGAVDGVRLVAEVREIEDCMDESACLKEIIQALINGPSGDLVPILPPHVVLRSVTEEGSVATADFSRELIDGHPGGSMSELLTVYGLADTLAANFPHLRQVRILVEGEAAETIKGHVGLREPIPADFSFTRPAAGAGNRGEDAVPIAPTKGE